MSPLQTGRKRLLKRLLSALTIVVFTPVTWAIVPLVIVIPLVAGPLLTAAAAMTYGAYNWMVGGGIAPKPAAPPSGGATSTWDAPPPAGAGGSVSPAQNTATSTPGASPGQATTHDDDCETKAHQMNEAEAKTIRVKAQADALLHPPMVRQLVVKPKVPLDDLSSPLRASLQGTPGTVRMLNGVPVASVEPLFLGYYTVVLPQEVPLAQAHAYATLLTSTQYFTSVELDLPIEDAQFSMRNLVDSYPDPLSGWHLNSKVAGGANIVAAWELLGEKTPINGNIVLIEHDGVWGEDPETDAMSRTSPVLHKGYNFTQDSFSDRLLNHKNDELKRKDVSFKLNAPYVSTWNFQPKDIRENMREATKSFFGDPLNYSSWFVPWFDGTGPDGRDWGGWRTARQQTSEQFYEGAWAKRGSHGAMVASVIAAYSNSGKMISGVVHNVNWAAPTPTDSAPSSDIGIFPVRARTLAEAARGMLWAAGENDRMFQPIIDETGRQFGVKSPRIINMSLGGSMPGGCPRYMQSAIDIAIKSGAIFVAATGNKADIALQLKGSPANCRGVISVTAHTFNGDLSSFSNASPDTTISAPGGGEACVGGKTEPQGIPVLSPEYGKSAGRAAISEVEGTSFSAPIVSGVIAMMLEVNPNLTSEEVTKILQTTGRVFPDGTRCALGGDAAKFCGTLKMLDAEAAVRAALDASASRLRNLQPVGGAVPSPARPPQAQPGASVNPFGSRAALPNQTPQPPAQLSASQVAQNFTQLNSNQIGALPGPQRSPLSAVQVVQPPIQVGSGSPGVQLSPVNKGSIVIPGATPHPSGDYPAGPIWNNANAQAICPTVCSAQHLTWNKAWTTTVPGKMSVCGCVR